MRIVLAAHSLAGLGGSETYVVTVADHLQRLGHDVWLHSPEHGRSTEAAQRLGVRVCDEHGLPPAPDALVTQDGVVACELARRYPLTPQVFVAHSDIFDLQLPPQLPDLVAAVVTLYDRVQRRIEALALPHEIVRLSQPIDVERFKPSRPLRTQPRVAVAVGNYVHGRRLELLARACARAGIELRHVGAHSESGAVATERVYDEADIVFGKARVILEAMACARAAYVFDHNGGDGWVTAESYERLAPDNFGGQSGGAPIDEDRLAADLLAYDAGMGTVNRDLVVARHSASKHAAAMVGVLARLVPRPAPVEAPLHELARLIRMYHRVDSHAFGLHADNSRLAARLHELEQELQRAQAEHGQQLQSLEAELDRVRAEHGEQLRELEALRGEVDAELADAQRARDAACAQRDAQAAEAARLARALEELKGTRRWRAVQAALAPADRLRRQRRIRAAATPLPAPASASVPPPAPFVVGVPRSGTTLLRFMLDAHTQLAIGPETGFGLVAEAHDGPPALLASITALETWRDLGLDADEALTLLAGVDPWSVGGGLRALYTEFAAKEGKPRWGDKTPLHLMCMPALAAALPEARFIHIIRDGRDVAVSLRGLPFAPGDGGIEAIAGMWRAQIRAGREQGRELPHYREVRYEQLVNEPERVLRELCDNIDLDYEPTMLRAHERAPRRMAQDAQARRLGARTITRDERFAHNAHVLRPPDPSRVGRWTQGLTADEVEQFEAVAGDLLAELGYR